MNALERLAGTYEARCDAVEQDLALARGQLRDHEARLDAPFPHDAYLGELTDLRDRLKAGLSQATPEPGCAEEPVSELTKRVKALRAAHTLDAAPERTVTRRVAAEEPITARIRRCSTTSTEPESTVSPVEPPPAGWTAWIGRSIAGWMEHEQPDVVEGRRPISSLSP